MRTNLLRLLAVLMAFGLIAAACGSDSDDTATEDTASEDAPVSDGSLPDLEGRTVSIAVENAYLPFNYIDAADGEAKGWDYDAIDEMCNRLNCVPDYQTFGWDGMIQAVSDGQFDMAADGITITEERAEVVDYSVGYINIDQRILVGLDEEEIVDIPALVASDCNVGTQPGTTNYDKAVDTVGEGRVQGFETFGFAVQALISGDVCAVFIDETAGQGYLGENADSVQLVGESLSSDELGFIFPKGSDLVAPFDAAINAMKADGSLDALAQTYFGSSFTITYDDIAEVE
jgi:polar amino acid transport system substrate-binding protein